VNKTDKLDKRFMFWSICDNEEDYIW
jgi:hypothetical protein